MINFATKIIQIFLDLEKYNKPYRVAFLCDVKKYILPILRCKLLVDETIKIEDKYLQYVDPDKFCHLAYLPQDYDYINQFLQDIIEKIKNIFYKFDYDFQYYYRIKSVTSMMNLSFYKKCNHAYDKFGVRIVFDTNPENFYQFAWFIVEILSDNFNIWEVRDYIDFPRKTGYSAIHLLILVENISIEIQIISYDDRKIKVPHFKYKQFISQNNLYIEKDVKTAEENIFKDFKKYFQCHF